jgi:uncharacterized membrane protein YhhN
MLITGFTIAIVISALLTMAVRMTFGTPRRWFYFFKPLTTTLIFLIAVTSPLRGWNPYADWVMVGLAFALVGDVFLMLSDKRFIWGLASFLVAHLCYILAFTTRVGFRESPWVSLPFIGVGVIIAAQIGARARRLRWPVTLYTFVLLAMAWRACVAWMLDGSPPALLAGVGALLFVISDTTLAINHFVRRFRWAQVVVLSAYYAAQTMIAWSTWPAWWPIL